jgi:hypothetical protein
MNGGSTALRRRAAVRFQINTALSRRCRSMRGDPKQRNKYAGTGYSSDTATSGGKLLVRR